MAVRSHAESISSKTVWVDWSFDFCMKLMRVLAIHVSFTTQRMLQVRFKLVITMLIVILRRLLHEPQGRVDCYWREWQVPLNIFQVAKYIEPEFCSVLREPLTFPTPGGT